MWKQLLQAWKSDNLLNQAWDESFEMLEIDREMFLEAIRVLRESDEALVNKDIRKKDILVNKYERAVRRKVMTHCTLAGTTELPSGMVLISIVIDIERIGDYCKNILDLAKAHPKRLVVGEHEAMLKEIEDSVKSRFDQTIDVMRSHDVEVARELMKSFKAEVAKVCDQIVFDAVQGSISDLTPSNNAVLVLYSRYLKRISAHLNNIISSVVNPFDRIGYKEKKKKKVDPAD